MKARLLGLLTAIAALGCHSPTYFGGWGEQQELGPAQAPVMPTLSNLKVVSEEGAPDIPLSPAFSPLVKMYEADMTAAEMGMYKVAAESEFAISYVNGPTFMPLTVTYVVVTVTNETLKNSYVISFKNDNLPYAKLKTLDISTGEINKPTGGFDPEVNTYEVLLPYATKTVSASGEPDPDSGRVIISDSPLLLETGKYSMSLQVFAPGYNVGTYVLNFVFDTAEPSRLDYLEISKGSLDMPFSPTRFNYTLTMPLEEITIFGQIAPGGTVSYDQGIAKHGGISIPKPVNGSVLKVTADNGPGFSPVNYFITLNVDTGQSKPKAYARLSALTWTPAANNTLFKRDGGTRVTGSDASGFNPETYNYEFYMDFGKPVASQLKFEAASAIPGAHIEMNHVTLDANQNVSTLTSVNGSLTLDADFDEGVALQICVSAADYEPVEYYLFFNMNEDLKPPAQLSELRITGVVNDSMKPAFDKDATFYTVNALRDSPILVRAVPEKKNHYVSYNASDAINSIQGNTVIKIKVDGGMKYRTTIYQLTIEVKDRQNPLLAILKVKGEEVPLVDGTFDYTVEIPYSTIDVPVDFYWEVQAPDLIADIQYSPDALTDWAFDSSRHGENIIVTLQPLRSELMRVKITCLDNTQAIYAVYLSRGQERDDTLVLEDLQLNQTTLLDFDPKKNVYEVYVTTAKQTVLGLKAAAEGATISYSTNGLSWETPQEGKSIDVDLNKTERVLVRVSLGQKHNDYAISITRSTQLYKVLTMAADPASRGTIEVAPASAITSGIPAGSPVGITLTPNSGYKIQPTPVKVEQASGPIVVSVKGTVPTNSSPSNFYFTMPASDVNITGFFEVLTSISNELISLTADDGTGNECMETFVGDVSSAVIAIANKSENADIAAVNITPKAPAGAKLFKMDLHTPDTTWIPIADEKPFTVSSVIKKTTAMVLIEVRPDNVSLGNKTYVLEVIHVPAVEEYTTGPHSWFAAAAGFYQIEAWGGSGGNNYLDNDTEQRKKDGSEAGGKGGWSKGILKAERGRELSVLVGGKGESGTREMMEAVARWVTGTSKGGYNGGGKSENYKYERIYGIDGGGGGWSGVTNTAGTRILVAGGGGGAGWIDGAISYREYSAGGPGGGGNGAGRKDDKMSDESRTNGIGADGENKGGGGGGGYIGGALGVGGSGYVDSSIFSDIDGKRGEREGEGRVKITWKGVKLSADKGGL